MIQDSVTEVPSFRRARKALLIVSVIILVKNILGAEIVNTNGDPHSASLSILGIQTILSRPELINIILVITVIFLALRYDFATHQLRREIKKLRDLEYRNHAVNFVNEIKDRNPSLLNMKHIYFFWSYTKTDQSPATGEPIDSYPHFIKSVHWTFLYSVWVEMKLLYTDSAYTEYYTPWWAHFFALASFVWV